MFGIWMNNNYSQAYCLLFTVTANQDVELQYTDDVSLEEQCTFSTYRCNVVEITTSKRRLPIVNWLPTICIRIETLFSISLETILRVQRNLFEFPAQMLELIMGQIDTHSNMFQLTFNNVVGILRGMLTSNGNQITSNNQKTRFLSVTNRQDSKRFNIHIYYSTDETLDSDRVPYSENECSPIDIVKLTIFIIDNYVLDWEIIQKENMAAEIPIKPVMNFTISKENPRLVDSLSSLVKHPTFDIAKLLEEMADKLTTENHFARIDTNLMPNFRYFQLVTSEKYLGKMMIFSKLAKNTIQLIAPENVQTFHLSSTLCVLYIIHNLFHLFMADNIYLKITNKNSRMINKCKEMIEVYDVTEIDLKNQTLKTTALTNIKSHWSAHQIRLEMNHFHHTYCIDGILPEIDKLININAHELICLKFMNISNKINALVESIGTGKTRQCHLNRAENTKLTNDNIARTYEFGLMTSSENYRRCEITMHLTDERSHIINVPFDIEELRHIFWQDTTPESLSSQVCILRFRRVQLLVHYSNIKFGNYSVVFILQDGHEIFVQPHTRKISIKKYFEETAPMYETYFRIARKIHASCQLMSRNEMIFIAAKQTYSISYNRVPRISHQSLHIVHNQPDKECHFFNTYGNATFVVDAKINITPSDKRVTGKISKVTVTLLQAQNKWTIISFRNLCWKLKHYNAELKIDTKRVTLSRIELELYLVQEDKKDQHYSTDYIGKVGLENYHFSKEWFVELESLMLLQYEETSFGLKPLEYDITNLGLEHLICNFLLLMPDTSTRPLCFIIQASYSTGIYYKLKKSLVIEYKLKQRLQNEPSPVMMVLCYEFFDNVFSFPLVQFEFDHIIVKFIKSVPVVLQ